MNLPPPVRALAPVRNPFREETEGEETEGTAGRWIRLLARHVESRWSLASSLGRSSGRAGGGHQAFQAERDHREPEREADNRRRQQEAEKDHDGRAS